MGKPLNALPLHLYPFFLTISPLHLPYTVLFLFPLSPLFFLSCDSPSTAKLFLFLFLNISRLSYKPPCFSYCLLNHASKPSIATHCNHHSSVTDHSISAQRSSVIYIYIYIYSRQRIPGLEIPSEIRLSFSYFWSSTSFCWDQDVSNFPFGLISSRFLL